ISAPAGERSKLISLRYFQSLFHQDAASASAGTSAAASATHLSDPFILSIFLTARPRIIRTARDGVVTVQRVGVFCRFRHSMSSGLQFSSPRPVTNTSSQDKAFCASGAADSLSAAPPLTALVAALLVPLAEFAAPDRDALTLLTSAGTPVAVPPKLIFVTPMTDWAAMLILPAAPMPASPALTVPTGAMRSTLPGGVVGSVWMVRIPLPVAAPEKSMVTVPSLPMRMDGGGAEIEVLAPRPASMLPSFDQIRMLPPPKVKMREEFTLTSFLA